MPGLLAFATPATGVVLPNSLCTSFVETIQYPLLTVDYHRGERERSLVTDTVSTPRPLRTWQLAKRLTVAQLATLLTFWEVTVEAGLRPFIWYDPFAVLPVGSSYDATGNNSTGRVVVKFRGDWSHALTVGVRVDVPNLALVEVA
jgi:hypothetical protein